MSKGATGLRRIWNAFHYSLAGFRAAYVNEAAFRQEVWLAVVLVPAALVLGTSPHAKAAMIACVLLVLVTELLNSAIEAVVDRISPEQHELSGRAKDIGSAAVLVSLVNLVVVWSVILLG